MDGCWAQKSWGKQVTDGQTSPQNGYMNVYDINYKVCRVQERTQ